MKKIIFSHVLIISVCIFLNFSLSAQQKWSGKFSVGGSYYSGNVNKTDIRSEGTVSHTDSTFEFATEYKTIYGRTNKVENNREFSYAVKFDWKPFSRFSPFLALENYSNVYKGYDLRLSSLAGLKWEFLKIKSTRVSVSSAALYGIENYTKPEDPSKPVKENREILRISFRPKIVQKLGESVTLKHTTYYQPNIRRFSDFNIENKTTLSNKLTNLLALDITLEHDYVSSPPSEEIKKQDVAFVISLRVNLN